MKILKFGGSSVGNPERIRNVAGIILASQAEEGQIAVVVSAYQGVTDKLIEMCSIAARGDKSYHDIFQELSDRHLQAVKDLVPVTNQSNV